MWIKFRHKVVFFILRPIFKTFYKIKYNTKIYNCKLKKKQPHLILSNHLTTLDPFLVSASFSGPIYSMASEDLFSSGFGKLISFLTAPIPKAKSKSDLTAIKDAMRVAKEGGNILIFPEGNRSYDGDLCKIDDSIVKLIKLLKLPLVLYNIVGGYGIDPRWSKKSRKGKSYGKVKRIIEYEALKSMSNEEIHKLIIDELSVKQFPTTYKYKCKKSAEGLERILYKCPICGSIETIYTKKRFVYCSNCNLKVKYNEYLEFESDNNDFKFKYVKDWYDYQKNYILSLEDSTKLFFSDKKIKLFKMEKFKKGDLLLEGDLSINDKAISIGNKSFNIEDINDVTVVGKRKINFYINNETYQLKGSKSLNVIKYYQAFYYIKNKNGADNNEIFGI